MAKKKRCKLNMKIKLPKGARYQIDVPPELFGAMPVNALVHGRPGAGKTCISYNILKKYKEAGLCDRILMVSPTAGSNQSLLDDLEIDLADVFDPTDKKVPAKITCVINDERDQFVADLKRVEDWEEFGRLLESGTNVYRIKDELWDEFTNIHGDVVEKPRFKYEGNATGGRPNIWCLWDDCISTPVWEKNQSFLNMAIRMRHLGVMPYRKGHNQMCGGLGLNNLYLVHQLTAERGGLPRLVRSNACQIIIVDKTANKKELKQLEDACSGYVEPEVFQQLYAKANQKRHDAFVVDFLAKRGEQPSMFRRNLDEFLIPD